MTGDDVPLYQAFRDRPPIRIATAFFNVRCGPPAAHLTAPGSSDERLIADLLAPRIDMLAFDGARWWVTEFHTQAGLPQLGRIDCYPELLCATYPGAPPLGRLMICSTVNPWTLVCYTRRRVALFTYTRQQPRPKPENIKGF